MADFWVRNLGGTSKAAAVDRSNGMNVATFNAASFDENDRIFFSNVDGNITTGVIVPSGGITLLTDPDPAAKCLIHGGDTQDSGIHVASKNDVEIDGIDVTHPATCGTRFTGTSTGGVVRNVDSSYALAAGGQAFQNEQSVEVTYYDVKGHHCTDDGFSAHDDAVCVVYRGDFYSCTEGINIIDRCKLTCYDCNVWDISASGRYLAPTGSTGNIPEITFIRGSIITKPGVIDTFGLYTPGKLICQGTKIEQTNTGGRIAVVGTGGRLEITDCALFGWNCGSFLIEAISGGHVKVWKNIFTGIKATKYALALRAGSTNDGFHRNLVVHDPRYSAGAGNGVYSVVDTVCSGNIFVNLANGIIREGGTITSTKNCFRSCTIGMVGGVTNGGGNITSDPLLTLDLTTTPPICTLQPASPCIGAGEAVTGLDTDINGDAIPGPCGTSIGPAEYLSDSSATEGMRSLFGGTLTLPVAPSTNTVCDVERVAAFPGTPSTSQINNVMTFGET